MMSYGNDSDRPWVLDEDAAEPIVRTAVEGGITFFDTADTYSDGASEVATGQDPAEVPDAATRWSSPRRCSCRWARARTTGASAASTSCPPSTRRLTRLGMDHVDLYQIHRWDRRTPIEETMEALHDVVKAGKARFIGASSMYAWQFAKAQHVAERNGWTRFVSMQNHWNLVYREEEREMVPQCIDQGVGRDPVEPARPRPPRRQRQPRGRGRHHPGRDRRVRPDALRAAGGLGRRRAQPGDRSRTRACRRRRPRWRGCSASPGSPRRSSAPPSRTTSRTRSPPSSSSSPATRSRPSRSPTCPTASSGHA